MTTMRQQGVRLNSDNLDEPRPGKNAITTRSTRSALNNIMNKVPNTRSQANGAKKDAVSKPERTLSKQKGTSSLSLKAKAPVAVKGEVPERNSKIIPESKLILKKQEPEPMEIVMPEDNVLPKTVSTVVPSFSSSNVILASEVEDIDEEDAGDPQLVVEFVNEIYMYLRYLEREQNVEEDYLKLSKNSITPKMRAVLIDWLIDVHKQFGLQQETLYLTVSLIDRFLQQDAGNTHRKNLQLVGVTAMFIASKYEEMYCPEIRDFVYITDNTYSQSQIRLMEVKMLSTLDFQLGRPLPLHFLRRNSKAGFADSVIHTLAKFVMELSIVNYKFAHILPSMLAAGALAYSLGVLSDDSENEIVHLWTPTLAHYSGYMFDEIYPLVKELAKLVQNAVKAPEDAKLMAVRKKYMEKKFLRIASHPILRSKVAVSLAERNLE